MDVAISVGNVMPWDRLAAFAGLTRVFGRGRLVITVQRRVLDVPPVELEAVARAVGFGDVRTSSRALRRCGWAVGLTATVSG